MYQHLLISTDGSLLSKTAIDNGLALARALNARVTVLTVVTPFHAFAGAADEFVGTRELYEKQAKQTAAGALADAERNAKEQGVQCTAVQLEHEHPFKAIIGTATKVGCDFIAMASHRRRGMAGIVLGTETSEVLARSSIPVLVYR